MSKTTSAGSSATKAQANISKAASPSRGIALDGIMFRRNGDSSQPEKSQLSENKNSDRTLQPSQNIHQRLKQSVTLMRQAVPAPKQTPRIKSDINRATAFSRIFTDQTKSAMPRPSAAKLAKARQITKHGKVSRFGQSVAPLPKTLIAPLSPTVNKIASRISATTTSSPPGVTGSGSSSGGALAMTRPMAVPAASISHQKLESMLDKALAQADSHKKILQEHTRRSFWKKLGGKKLILLAAAAAVVLTAAISFAYLKIPAFSTRVASVRAGIKAQAPSYVPAGFGLTKTSFSNGNVLLKFSNGSSSFTLSQASSGLNSDSLKENFVSTKSKLYQTSQYNGVTVYTYKESASPILAQDPPAQSNTAAADKCNSNATWVNHGIQGMIDNEACLPSDQIGKIIEGVLR